MALYMDSLGLINIAELDNSIAISLMYTKTDNFTGEILYNDLSEAYLHPHAAYALLKAQEALKALHPSYSLIIYDAARPMSVQRKMWDVVKGTSKYRYVSNPNRGGGLHNYGLAVDISIQDSLERPLPMGTKVDHLGVEAHITEEGELIRNGKITETELSEPDIIKESNESRRIPCIAQRMVAFQLLQPGRGPEEIQRNTINEYHHITPNINNL